jgi:hypothetical protein
MSTTFHTSVELTMALQRLVPSMAHGLTISTPAGGSITLLPGRLADRLADELSQHLRLELMRREARVAMEQRA